MAFVTSKIKEVFGDELIRNIAAVCRTRKIESNAAKMRTIYGLLNEANIDYEPLGDATNRLAVQKDAYAFKIALDEAGYKDNWMEYSLSDELQPYVTHTYETNGFIAVAECVKSLSEEDFYSRKNNMAKILDIIGSEYLLGDVGLTMKQYKNWGIRDSGEVVILDYAYVHRATEELFLCKNCGELLRYNESFTQMICGGRDGCGSSFPYEQKRAQIPDSEIQRVIDLAKSDSILMKDPTMDINVKDINKHSDPNTIVIRSNSDLKNYLKEESKMYETEDGVGKVLEMVKEVRQGKNVNEAIKDNFGETNDKTVIIEEVEIRTSVYGYDEDDDIRLVPVVNYTEDPEEIDPDEEDQIYSELMTKLINKRGTSMSHLIVPSEDDEDNEDIPGIEVGNDEFLKPSEPEKVETVVCECPCTNEKDEELTHKDVIKTQNSSKHIIISGK